jgi:hypothetical protein
MSISYFVGGRLGNNLFQYFTAKVFCKLLNKKYIFNTKFNFKVTDDNFNSFYENYSECKVDNIFFDGYFQTNFLMKYKEYIQSLLTNLNEDKVNNNLTIKNIIDLMNRNSKRDELLNDNILYVHIRLDDFIYTKNQIVNPNSLQEYINNILKENTNITKCAFIVDHIRQKWEADYMNILLSNVKNSYILQNDMFTDLYIMMNCKYIIASRSTFSWISILLSSKCEKVWIPVKIPLSHSHQTLDNIHSNTTLFYPTFI